MCTHCSITATLFAGMDRIREIGYEDAPFTNCLAKKGLWERERRACDPAHSFGMRFTLRSLVDWLLLRSLFVLFRLRWVLVPAEVESGGRWVSTSMTTSLCCVCPLRLELSGSSLFSRLLAITLLVVLYSSSPCDLSLSASLLSLFRVSCFSSESTHTGKSYLLT